MRVFVDQWKKEGIWLDGDADLKIQRVSSDSREKFLPSTLFFARTGANKDGHEFLKDLESRREIAGFVVERLPTNFQPKVPVFVVRDSTKAMAIAVKSLTEDPSRSMHLVAVTGTNGKTTSTYLLRAILEGMGLRTAVSGTVATEFENFRVKSELTTPDFSQLQDMLKNLKEKGAQAVAFEASSHALYQRRLLGLEMDGALFTNLTPEHLDYHKTMEHYFESKKKLFIELLRESNKKDKVAVLPDDGAYGSRLIQEFQKESSFRTLTFGFKQNVDLQITSWRTGLEGSEIEFRFQGKKADVQTKLVGSYNVMNIAGAVAYGLARGLDFYAIQTALEKVPGIPGRLEPVQISKPAKVFVDYAHTPDALENVLQCLRPLSPKSLKLVFGCGGDRDRQKRPMMGQIAELYADEIFVTSDNPRTEDPQAILDEILSGLQRTKKLHVNPDRRAAIFKALESLEAGDVLIIAGKGHETTQTIGKEIFDFDDREVVREFFRRS